MPITNDWNENERVNQEFGVIGFYLSAHPLDNHRSALKKMNIFTYGKVLAWSNQRSLDALKAGKTPGPEMSLSKMGLTRQMQATCNFVSDVLETRLVADTGEWGTFSWGGYVLGQPAMRIAGGSDEVMRNIVGERVLGLPKEPGIDTTSPFRELKVGTQRSE